ncbi:MAG: lipocalin family protein [Bacteroidales bacterium]|nr:lipocalin family protein [Bacteroidales bacterium]
MKNKYTFLILVSIFAAIFALSSCKKSNEELIIGSWKCTSSVADSNAPSFVNTVWTFSANKSLVVEAQDRTDLCTYSVNKDKLNLFMDGEYYTADINKLDSKALSITMSGPFIVIDETTHYVSVKMYFLKQ